MIGFSFEAVEGKFRGDSYENMRALQLPHSQRWQCVRTGSRSDRPKIQLENRTFCKTASRIFRRSLPLPVL